MLAEGHRILIETYSDVALSRHVNIGSIDSNVMISMLKNIDLQALLDENPAQSTSELARELNVDRTIVIKRLRDIYCLNKSVFEKKIKLHLISCTVTDRTIATLFFNEFRNSIVLL